MQPLDIRMLSCDFKYNRNDEHTDENPVDTDISSAYELNVEDRVITCLVRAESCDTNAPFTFHVEFGGKFLVSEKEISDPEAVKRLAEINCPAIVYPYVREFTSTLVGRANLPHLFLPIVNFVKGIQSE